MSLPSSPSKGVLNQNQRQRAEKSQGKGVQQFPSQGYEWLKETLTLVSIRVSWGSTRKIVTCYATSQGASIKKFGSRQLGTHFFHGSHYIMYLLKEVLVRIIEQTSGSIQGCHRQPYDWRGHTHPYLFITHQASSETGLLRGIH